MERAAVFQCVSTAVAIEAHKVLEAHEQRQKFTAVSLRCLYGRDTGLIAAKLTDLALAEQHQIAQCSS